MKQFMSFSPPKGLLLLIGLAFTSSSCISQVLKYRVKQFADRKKEDVGDTKFEDVDYGLSIDQAKKAIFLRTPYHRTKYRISQVLFDNSTVMMICTDSTGFKFLTSLRRFPGSIHPMMLTMDWRSFKWIFMMDILSEKME